MNGLILFGLSVLISTILFFIAFVKDCSANLSDYIDLGVLAIIFGCLFSLITINSLSVLIKAFSLC